MIALVLFLLVAGVAFWLWDGRLAREEIEALAIGAGVYVIAKWGNGSDRWKP